jgi:hypothetical protein
MMVPFLKPNLSVMAQTFGLIPGCILSFDMVLKQRVFSVGEMTVITTFANTFWLQGEK